MSHCDRSLESSKQSPFSEMAIIMKKENVIKWSSCPDSANYSIKPELELFLLLLVLYPALFFLQPLKHYGAVGVYIYITLISWLTLPDWEHFLLEKQLAFHREELECLWVVVLCLGERPEGYVVLLCWYQGPFPLLGLGVFLTLLNGKCMQFVGI